MKSLKVIIEPGKDGFGVLFTTPGLENVTSFGETLDEAKENAREALSDFIDYYNEIGKELPGSLKTIDPKTVKLKFNFMLHHYLKEYPYLNISQLASYVEINPSLLRQYDKGLGCASEKKYFELREGLRTIGRELESAL